MFWFLIDVLTLRRLGLGRPFRFILLAIFLGCLAAGIIYAAITFQAVNRQQEVHHVEQHTNR